MKKKQNTKKLIGMGVLLCIIIGCYFLNQSNGTQSNQSGVREAVQFERCVDGDTFVARTKRFGSVKIRLSGVNTPELAHPEDGIKEEYYGKEAQEYTCKRLKSAQNMTVEWDQTQEASHGRQIAVLFIGDINFNLELFSEGYSSNRYLKNTMPYASEYQKAMQEAKKQKKGMWAKT